MAHLIDSLQNYPTEFQFQNFYRYVSINEELFIYRRTTREEEGGPVSSREFYVIAAHTGPEAEAIANEEIDRHYGGDWNHTIERIEID